MADFNFVTLFPKPNDFRFHPVDPQKSSIYNTYSFDQTSLRESLLYWQTPNKYKQKRLFNDLCTIMLHTQVNTGSALPYPDLLLYDCTMTLITTIDSGIYGRGAQQIAGNNDTNPETGVVTPLNSYLWTFYFNQFLDPSQSGVYFIVMRNKNADGTISDDWISEPINVFGTDAAVFPNTMLIQGRNDTNRTSQAWVVSGWDNDYIPTAQHRIEAQRRPYNPKGILVSFIEQEYQARQLQAQNYRSFILSIGGQSDGIPDYEYEKLSEATIMDFWTADGIPYIIDTTDSDAGIKQMWKPNQPEAAQLGWYTLEIRERYNSQYVGRRTVMTPCSCPPLIQAQVTKVGESYYANFYFNFPSGFICPFDIMYYTIFAPTTFYINSLADMDFVSGTIYKFTRIIGGAPDIDYNIYRRDTGAVCNSGHLTWGCTGPVLYQSALTFLGGVYTLSIQYTNCGIDCHTMNIAYTQTGGTDSGSFIDNVPCPAPYGSSHTVTPSGSSPTKTYRITATDCCGNVSEFDVSYTAPCDAPHLQTGPDLHDKYVAVLGFSGGVKYLYIAVGTMGSTCNTYTVEYTQTNALSSGIPDSGTFTGTVTSIGFKNMGTLSPNYAFADPFLMYHTKYTDCCGNVIEEDIYNDTP